MNERIFQLTVTEADINIISAGLGELPFKHSSALVAKLQTQLNDQLNAAPPEVQESAE